MRYEILIGKKASALENMELDQALLHSLSVHSRCIVHLYQWKHPSVTYGYFSDPSRHLHLRALTNLGFDLARRPTGGGIIFHHCDLSFSVLVPVNHPGYSHNVLSNYALINTGVSDALQKFSGRDITLLGTGSKSSPSFCMSEPTCYDLMLEERKVGGAAQRRMKQGFLHQGTIALTLPSPEFLDQILIDKELAKAMTERSRALLSSQETFEEAKARLQSLLIKSLRQVLRVE